MCMQGIRFIQRGPLSALSLREVISRALECPARQKCPCLLEVLVTGQFSCVIYDEAFRTVLAVLIWDTWRLNLPGGLRLKVSQAGSMWPGPSEDSGHTEAGVSFWDWL